ncbi:hypothetical protein [Ochrobactrum sp. 3-3]|uniref:hypothetical protein n=1 Tax=Ochrobactrum sp. 3-3 TaxID=1830124 RepID=UPI000DEFF866|nr:hypothetical protein [Ochrobactrum sp. 3-3]
MKLTREERYALTDIAIAPEGISFCPDEVKNLQNKGLVEVVESTDGNYAIITSIGRRALKGDEE